jgi:flagellar biosynthesis protein FlhA
VFQKVLGNLLKEHVSIRNLPIIFETLADYSKMTSDVDILTEYTRQSLAKQITTQYAGNNHVLKVLTVSGRVEKLIADSIQQTEHGNYLSIDPNDSQAIIESMAREIERASLMEQSPIILCSPAVRMYMRQMTERYFPQVPILSYNELESSIEVQSVGVVNVE